MNKKNILLVLLILIVAFASYSYGASKASVSKADTVGGKQRGGGMNRGGGDAFITGDIISHDDTSVTIQLKDTGSKIVFVSASSTKISKITSGTLSDLTVGTKVMINGTTNSDGSVTANTVQLRKDN